MNPAYKHLETKLRIFDLTLGQWAGILLGVGLGIGWGVYLCPFGSFITLASSVYLAGIPALIAFLNSQTDFDLWLRVRSLVRWRRRRERYRPGAGTPTGYVIVEAAVERGTVEGPARLPELDPLSLWE